MKKDTSSIKNFKSGERGRFTKPAVTLILALILILILIAGAMNFERLNMEQNRELTLSSIKKATVQCYANEGRYPSSLEYLEEKYDVSVDHEKFYVLYDSFGENMMPNINVYIN